MESVRVRQEGASDLEAVRHIIAAAFGQQDEADLVDRLRMSSAFVPELSLVAERNGNVVGHVMFTKAHIECEQSRVDTLALAPVSVIPGHQKTGVGSALTRGGIECARSLGFQSVIVLGHAEYYPRFGFRPASTWKIGCPYPVSDEVFMALELSDGALTNAAGMMTYAPEFNG